MSISLICLKVTLSIVILYLLLRLTSETIPYDKDKILDIVDTLEDWSLYLMFVSLLITIGCWIWE